MLYNKEKGGINMAILYVEDMHCDACVARINKALDAVEIKHIVSLEDKTVTIEGCEHCVATAISELDDLGFDAVEK